MRSIRIAGDGLDAGVARARAEFNIPLQWLTLRPRGHHAASGIWLAVDRPEVVDRNGQAGGAGRRADRAQVARQPAMVTAHVSAGIAVTGAETDLRTKERAEIAGRHIAGRFPPFEIKTLRLR